jgi:ABC-type dipeptide/oligopeptide/nickel transport system permease subunit
VLEAINTIAISLLATALTLSAGLVVAYAMRVGTGPVPAALARLASLGYAVPGTVLAIGLLPVVSGVEATVDAATRRLLGLSSGLLLLGTDNFGRDVTTELVRATGVSLLIGLFAGLIATSIGLSMGLLAGYLGGVVDDVIMFVTNLFTVIPTFVLLILISFSIGQEQRGAFTIAVVIGFTSWNWTTRAVRPVAGSTAGSTASPRRPRWTLRPWRPNGSMPR